MKKRSILLAGLLLLGMTMSVTVWAEETAGQAQEALSETQEALPEAQEEAGKTEEGSGGLLGALLGEGGVVSSLLSEGGAVSSLLSEKGADAINGLLGTDKAAAVSSLLEDTGVLESLFGEDGALSGVVPEGVDIGQIMDTVGKQITDPDSKLYQGLNFAADIMMEADDGIDRLSIGAIMNEMAGAFSGNEISETGETGEFDFEEFMAPYKALDEIAYAYVEESNAVFLETGDATIMSKQAAYVDDPDLDLIKILAIFSEVNYSIDGDRMTILNAAADPMLLTLAKGQDGTLSVVAAKTTEDGEGYAASLEDLCAEVGMTTDDYYASMVFGVYNDADALAEYLEAHPEIKTAEYNGEQMSAEELRSLSEAYINGLMDSLFGTAEVQTETATEALTEAPAQALTEAVTE